MIPCPSCKGTGGTPETPCKLCRGKKGVKIVMGSTQELEYLEIYVKTVVEALERAAEIDVMFISDISKVMDFFALDKEHAGEKIRGLSEELGVPIDGNDRIYDVARKLKNL